MRPYISRDNTIHMMRIAAQRDEDNNCDVYVRAFCRKIWEKAISVVRHESGFDVVPVVRCHECRHYEEDYFTPYAGMPAIVVAHHVCRFWGRGCVTRPDGFCHWGEPKEDGE